MHHATGRRLQTGASARRAAFKLDHRLSQLDPEQRAAVPAAVAAWCEEMDARGVRLAGHVLGPLAEARTIRIRAGELTVGDGPVAEQTVQIAGFNILECADLDEALEVASKNPGANFGTLELRPIES